MVDRDEHPRPDTSAEALAKLRGINGPDLTVTAGNASGVNDGEDPYHLHLCRANLDGTGFTVLTKGDGTHTVDFSPDRAFFIDGWSRVDQPPVHVLRSAGDGALIASGAFAVQPQLCTDSPS